MPASFCLCSPREDRTPAQGKVLTCCPRISHRLSLQDWSFKVSMDILTNARMGILTILGNSAFQCGALATLTGTVIHYWGDCFAAPMVPDLYVELLLILQNKANKRKTEQETDFISSFIFHHVERPEHCYQSGKRFLIPFLLFAHPDNGIFS